MSQQVAIWIDHKQARVFRIATDASDETTILAPLNSIHHKHPKGPEGVKEHPEDAKRFFHDVDRSVQGAQEILLVGPSTAKFEFLRYLHLHDPVIERGIVGVETVDHPSDGQLIAYAREYFRASNGQSS